MAHLSLSGVQNSFSTQFTDTLTDASGAVVRSGGGSVTGTHMPAPSM